MSWAGWPASRRRSCTWTGEPPLIVREEGGDLLLVRQSDHAQLSGQLAALWGNPPWNAPQPRDSVVLGARLHDLAWVPFDETLPRRPDGRPYAFFEVSRNVTIEFYGRGVEAVTAMDGYAGLLCSLHYTGFHVSQWGWPELAPRASIPDEVRPAVEHFLAAEGERQDGLRKRLGVDSAGDAELGCNYKWLQLWDRISLDVCRRGFTGWRGEYPAVPASPLPGAAALTLTIEMEPGGICRLAPYPLLCRPYAARIPAVLVRAGDDLDTAWLAGGAFGIDVTFV